MGFKIEFNHKDSYPHPFSVRVTDIHGRVVSAYGVPLEKADYIVEWIEANTKHHRTDFYKWGQSKITGYDLTAQPKGER